ncbi:MAG TPA: glucokinase [Patescibacteria group bacterium]|nr:glucokinase [Patescibacteria group bacterium]
MTVIATDIGGTHARLALVENAGLGHPEKIAAADFATFPAALDSWCAKHGQKNGGKLLIATAAQPATDGVWRFLNGSNPWVIDSKVLARAGWQVEILVNDFAASARGALTLPPSSLTIMREGRGTDGAGKAILGPGTGLGMAYMTSFGERWRVQETFGGHMLAAALTDEQFTVIKTIRELRGAKPDVVPEDLASGRALPNLYKAVCVLNGRAPADITADEILAKANSPDARQVIQQVLRLFHEFLGLFAHNVVVTTHAFAGVYLDGGVIQRLYAAKLFDRESFERGFMPAMVPTVHAALNATPVWLINDPFVALRGLVDMMDNDPHA